MAEDAVVTGFFKRQQLLDGEGVSHEQLSREAERLAGEGLTDEAVTFYARAENEGGLKEMAHRCRKDGDAFGFAAASHALGTRPDTGDWKELGGTALALGKLWFAYRAFAKAEDQEGLEKVRQRMAEANVQVPPR